jgi:hypothetical protein
MPATWDTSSAYRVGIGNSTIRDPRWAAWRRISVSKWKSLVLSSNGTRERKAVE